MTKDSFEIQPIENAIEIIERFGGIRPMASKIGAAVTTVQGWKKRNTIPATRVEDILKAAQDHDINLSDLTPVPNHLKTTNSIANYKGNEKSIYQPNADLQPKEKAASEDNIEKAPQNETIKTSSNNRAAIQKQKDVEDIKGIYESTLHDDIIYTITQAERRAVEKSKWTSFILVGISTLALALIFGMQSGSKPEHQRVAELKAMQEEMKALKEQVNQIKENEPAPTLLNKSTVSFKDKVSNLANEAKEISKTLVNGSNEDIKKQIAALESQIDGLGNIASITQRFGAFTATIGGQNLLEQSTDDLSAILKNVNTDDDRAIDRAIDSARNTSTSLNQSLEGVPQNDLKAAAMLLTMTQLRSTLNRDNEPFNEDLELLQSLVGDNSPEIQESIEKLSPHAQGGILTSSGLSNELRSLTGEIVVASLKGEKLSIKDRAKARLKSKLLAQSENGETLPNANAQETLSSADKLLQQGNIQGAISLMKTLDGPAAKIAKPWINEAQTTLLAQQLKTTLSGVLDAKAAGIKGYSKTIHSGGPRQKIYLSPN